MFPESLQGTPLDPRANRKRRERLCTRLEELLGSYGETPHSAPAEDLAQKLKQALAANTIGGVPAEEKKKIGGLPLKKWNASKQIGSA